jgi:outer membrane protein insertion porin family
MATTYAPKKLVFTGADQYKAADLTTVTGLTPGKLVTTEEVEAAMQKLVDTGLFSDMRYTVNDQALTFMLTPVAGDQLLQARYKNFVWWSDEELNALVHGRIPLFNGQVPVTGTMKDGVASALIEILASKSVKASVSSVNSANLGGKVGGTLFAIDDPLVEVGEVRVDQVSAGAAASIADVKKRFTGQDYDAYSSGPSLRQNVQNAYLDLGYLDIAVDPPVRGTPDAGQSAIRVSLTTTAHEGSTYHVSKMDWPESQIVSKATFAEASQLKSGDLASRMVLMRTENAEAARFQAVGYLDAKVSSQGKKDEAKHEIAYVFEAMPGEQYKVASIKTPGLSADQQAEFDKVWKLAPGQFYNSEPIGTALQKLASNKAFQGLVARPELQKILQTHTVVLTISFVKKARS